MGMDCLGASMEKPSLSVFKYRLDAHLAGMTLVELITSGKTDEKAPSGSLQPSNSIITNLQMIICLLYCGTHMSL